MTTLFELDRLLKSERVPNVFLISASSGFLIRSALNRIRDVLGAGASYTEKFDGKKLKQEELYGAVMTPSFGAGRRTILLDEPEFEKFTPNQIKDFETIIDGADDNSLLLIKVTGDKQELKKSARFNSICKAVDKKNVLVMPDPLSSSDLIRLAKTTAERRGSALSDKHAKQIVELSASDPDLLLNETEKLAADGTPITSEKIALLACPTPEARVYDLFKSLSAKNFARTMDILDSLFYLREPPISIVAAFSSSFTDLYRAKIFKRAGVSADTAVRELGYRGREFRIKNAYRDCERYSTGFLKQSVKILSYADISLKSTRTDPRIVIETAITQIFILLNAER